MTPQRRKEIDAKFTPRPKEQAGHTPGEWKLQGPKIQKDFGDQTYWTIMPDPYKSKADPYKAVGFYYPYSGLSNKEAEANASLIEAAPSLLEALKEMIKWVDKYGFWITDRVIDNEANKDIDNAKKILQKVNN